MTGSRVATERPLSNRARKAVAALRRWEARVEEANQQVEAAQQDLALIHSQACERFGRDVPTDALLLDVLDLVDVEPGDRWLWRGGRNNRGTPTVRDSHHREMTVMRFLAVGFGVIDEDDFGVLYPVDGDTDDVNPWHRKLRRSNHPIGNPNRFGFTLPRDGDK